MNPVPLTTLDQERIALHSQLMRGFFKKIVVFAACLFALVAAFLFYTDYFSQLEPTVRYTFIGILCVMPFFQYASFMFVTSVMEKQFQKHTTKQTITGSFGGLKRDAETGEFMVVTTTDGLRHRVPARGLNTLLSGQRDDVTDAIKHLQTGQTVTVEYVEKPNLVLAVR
jgi:hypothetical protein